MFIPPQTEIFWDGEDTHLSILISITGSFMYREYMFAEQNAFFKILIQMFLHIAAKRKLLTVFLKPNVWVFPKHKAVLTLRWS